MAYHSVRCTRSCFQCPICIAPLSVNSLETPDPLQLASETTGTHGSWVLSCSYCNWSSKEIGIKFEKPNSIFSQLSKIRNGGEPIVSKERRLDGNDARRRPLGPLVSGEDEDHTHEGPDGELDPDTRFANLRTFFQSQLSETSTASPLNFGGDFGFGSPGNLSRIMGLYTGGSFADKKTKNKSGSMREAHNASEGFYVCPHTDNTPQELAKAGWNGTASHNQRAEQSQNQRFTSDLRPIAYLLRTKRSKRCKTCRHILTKPENKVQTTRFRIRLVALNYIPTMTIRPLAPPQLVVGNPVPTSSPFSTTTPLLTPYKPSQFLLTLKNPLFDPIKITLATPANTPGRFSSKVTILCPQFDVGANTDVWDEALQDGSGGKADGIKRRTVREVGEGHGAAEAGKVWERGRNWVSVVVEVVPASLTGGLGKDIDALRGAGLSIEEETHIREDDDILEIPVFVRIEWETDAANEESAATASREKDVKEKRELAYWCVLGVGRIAQP
jgi:dynactin-4